MIFKSLIFDKIMNFKMKASILFVLLIFTFFLCGCNKMVKPRDFKQISIETLQIDSASIRAIHVLKDSTLLYATSNGIIGKNIGFGKNSFESNLKYDTIIPHFRAITSNGTSIFALSIGNPALLFKNERGRSKLVYKEIHENVFYDAMAFFDAQNGIAMGDPTEGCLSILLTNDGGATWKKIPCAKLPRIEEGEAAFAASNTNIAIVDSNVWLATGGKKARVFHSADKGSTWKVYDTPIVQGGKMTGIYSVDFFDSKNGIIFGGDWEQKDNNTANKAITIDGGKTWQLVANGKEPGYKSCVQYVPETEGKELFAVGSTGISFSKDSGKSWRKVSDEKDYYTIRFVNKNVAWLAGKNKIGKLILN